jgi:hypothetical protein
MEPEKKNNTCEYCNKNFSTKSSLNTHKKTAKSCNNNSGKKSYDCEYCKKIFSSTNGLQYHVSICDVKKEKDNEIKIKDDYEKKIEVIIKENLEKEKQYLEIIQKHKESVLEETSQLRTTVSILQTKLETAEKQLEKYERQIEILQTKPATKTINNTTINDKSIIFNNYFPKTELANSLSGLNDNHISIGMTSLAAYLKEKVLTKDGNLIYKCTDTARQLFKLIYDGIEIKDKTATLLVNTIKPVLLDRITLIIQAINENKSRIENIPKDKRTEEQKRRLDYLKFLIDNRAYQFRLEIVELDKNHLLSLELSRII